MRFVRLKAPGEMFKELHILRVIKFLRAIIFGVTVLAVVAVKESMSLFKNDNLKVKKLLGSTQQH